MDKIRVNLTNPCPACGNTKHLGIHGFGDDWWITCPVCGYTSEGGSTMEEAAADWNAGKEIPPKADTDPS